MPSLRKCSIERLLVVLHLGCVAVATFSVMRMLGAPRQLSSIAADNPDWLVEIRQDGLVIGLRFAHPDGARFVSRRLYEAGVWALCRLCPDSLPLLIQGLESPSILRRRASARVLCYLGLEARPASKAMEKALDDDDPVGDSRYTLPIPP